MFGYGVVNCNTKGQYAPSIERPTREFETRLAAGLAFEGSMTETEADGGVGLGWYDAGSIIGAFEPEGAAEARTVLSSRTVATKSMACQRKECGWIGRKECGDGTETTARCANTALHFERVFPTSMDHDMHCSTRPRNKPIRREYSDNSSLGEWYSSSTSRWVGCSSSAHGTHRCWCWRRRDQPHARPQGKLRIQASSAVRYHCIRVPTFS